MKKLLVLVAAVVAGAAAVFAGSLNDAFRAVSALPGMKVAENADSVDVAGPEFLDSLEVAYVNGLDGPQIRNVGNRLYDIIETLPMGEMVVGANNGLVAGFVYAEEIEGGGYEVLIVTAPPGLQPQLPGPSFRPWVSFQLSPFFMPPLFQTHISFWH